MMGAFAGGTAFAGGICNCFSFFYPCRKGFVTSFRALNDTLPTVVSVVHVDAFVVEVHRSLEVASIDCEEKGGVALDNNL